MVSNGNQQIELWAFRLRAFSSGLNVERLNTNSTVCPTVPYSVYILLFLSILLPVPRGLNSVELQTWPWLEDGALHDRGRGPT